MSIIVEDGTGLATAESYISVADASTYFTARGNTTWDALDEGEATAAREAALRLATDYMTAVYRDRWEGVRYTEGQALCWPRSGVVRDSWSVDIDEIMYQLYVIDKIRKGRDASAKKDTISIDALKKEIEQW